MTLAASLSSHANPSYVVKCSSCGKKCLPSVQIGSSGRDAVLAARSAAMTTPGWDFRAFLKERPWPNSPVAVLRFSCPECRLTEALR